MDKKEFAERVSAISTKLHRTAMAIMGGDAQAADALGEAVYRGLRSCGKLKDPAVFDTWMTRILINECYREKKREKRLLPLEELTETEAPELDALPLKEALARLPDELREVIALRYFAGYTLRETAEILGLPQGTAATRQRRALALLRLELEEEEA